MADSSSVQEHSDHPSFLTIKPNRKLILDLAPVKYDPYMLPIAECLKYTPLVNAFTKVECVPLSLFLKPFSSAKNLKEEEKIIFEVHDKKHSISKTRFCSLRGLNCIDSMVNPESITTAQVFEMF